jgi:uncharacterized membrane protein
MGQCAGHLSHRIVIRASLSGLLFPRLAAFLLVSAILAFASPALGQSLREGYVNTQFDALRVHRKPELDSVAIAAADRGQKVTILRETPSADWY